MKIFKMELPLEYTVKIKPVQVQGVLKYRSILEDVQGSTLWRSAIVSSATEANRAIDMLFGQYVNNEALKRLAV